MKETSLKRFGAIGLVLFAVFQASQGATNAQSPPIATATTVPSATPSPVSTATPTTAPTATSTPGSTPSPTATAPPVRLLSPTTFALSRWYFPPPAATITSQVETNDLAAANRLILHFGVQSFAAQGRVTGYFADYGVRNLDAHGISHPAFTHYLVSSFPSVVQAMAAFTQQRSGWDTAINDPTSSINGQLNPVSLRVRDQMSQGIYQAQVKTTAGTDILYELLFQRGPYFVEVWQEMSQKDVAKYAAADRPFLLSLAKTLDTLADGQRLPATPKRAVRLHIQSVRFEANRTTQGLAKAPLKSTKTGSQVELGAYFVLTSAPPRSQVTGNYWLTMGKRELHKTYKHTLGAYPPNYYHQYVYNVKVPRAGTYHLRVVIAIGKISTSGTASLNVSSTGRVTLTNLPGSSLVTAQTTMTGSRKTVRRDFYRFRA
jgi:hypothetical protein